MKQFLCRVTFQNWKLLEIVFRALQLKTLSKKCSLESRESLQIKLEIAREDQIQNLP